jgi:hypothetical protein
MGTQSQIDEVLHGTIPLWSFAKRLAFRFCLTYLGLICLTTQIFGGLFLIPKFLILPGTRWPLRQITFWTAAHILRITHPLVYAGTGSGDKTFDWVEAFCMLVFAVIATGMWSVLDRQRLNYVRLHKWFRLFLRFAVAAEMFSYGMYKVIPVQMSFPFLTRWVEPFGNFTPEGVLWNSIGASPAYEMFAGCAEMVGGILLLVPRTAMFGALIVLADLIQVFMLNMAYDVPVKLLSFHLILMTLFLLAPELSRLANFFFLNRAVGPSTQPQLFRTLRANRIALALQILFGIYLVGVNTYNNWTGWYAFGGGGIKSPFYGIWDVDQLTVDGQLRPPLLTDHEGWRRVIFDLPTSVNFQRMDDSFAGYGAAIDVYEKTIALTKGTDKNWKANFTFQRLAPDQLTLDGTMDNHRIRMQLQLVDRNRFPLFNRKFHWIAEYPFNEVRR